MVFLDARGKVKFLEPAQVMALMEAPRLRSLSGLRNYCVMGLCYEAAMRIGEVLDVRPRDVSIDEKKVWVRALKGGEPRYVAFRSDQLSLAIEKWKEARPPSEYLFCTVKGPRKGEKLSYYAFLDTFKRYARRAGLQERVTPHSLRHTRASEFRREGLDAFTIQKILGHKYLNNTMRYVHLFDDEIVRAMRGY